jgi:hypothetical protein
MRALIRLSLGVLILAACSVFRILAAKPDNCADGPCAIDSLKSADGAGWAGGTFCLNEKPVTTESLGHCTWTMLHSIAAYLQEDMCVLSFHFPPRPYPTLAFFLHSFPTSLVATVRLQF